MDPIHAALLACGTRDSSHLGRNRSMKAGEIKGLPSQVPPFPFPLAKQQGEGHRTEPSCVSYCQQSAMESLPAAPLLLLLLLILLGVGPQNKPTISPLAPEPFPGAQGNRQRTSAPWSPCPPLASPRECPVPGLRNVMAGELPASGSPAAETLTSAWERGGQTRAAFAGKRAVTGLGCRMLWSSPSCWLQGDASLRSGAIGSKEGARYP